MRTLILAVLLLVNGVADGQLCGQQGCPSPYPQSYGVSSDINRWPQACIVSVPGGVENGGQVYYHGSGVLVGSRMVMTAAHVLRDGNKARITVRFPASGRQFRATVAQTDTNNDIASVLIDGDPGVPPVTLAEQESQPGEAMTVVGFDHGKTFMARRCSLLGFAGASQELLTVDVSVPQGCSGGFALNARGRFCGIISAADRTSTLIVCGRRGTRFGLLRRLLSPILPPPAPIIIQNTPQAPQPIPTPEQPISGQIDYEHIAALVAAKLREDPAFRGPAGQDGVDGKPGQTGPQGPPGPVGPPGDSQLTPERLNQIVANVALSLKSDPEFISLVQSDLTGLTARIEELERIQKAPLFYHKATLLVTDAEGNVVNRIELQPKTPVLRGGTLEYVGTPREGAITDSFRVDAGD